MEARKKYERNLALYQRDYQKAIKRSYPIDGRGRSNLARLARDLDIRDQDVEYIHSNSIPARAKKKGTSSVLPQSRIGYFAVGMIGLVTFAASSLTALSMRSRNIGEDYLPLNNYSLLSSVTRALNEHRYVTRFYRASRTDKSLDEGIALEENTTLAIRDILREAERLSDEEKFSEVLVLLEASISPTLSSLDLYQVYYRMGLAHKALGVEGEPEQIKNPESIGKAQEYYDIAISLLADNKGQSSKLADLHNKKGILAYLQGDWIAAVADFELSIEYTEKADSGLKRDVLYTNLGNAHRQNKDFEAASASYRQAISINEDSADSYYGLGAISEEENDDLTAASMYGNASDIYCTSGPDFYQQCKDTNARISALE